MAGINKLGTPQPGDYLLGRGRVYLAKLNTTTGLPDDDGYRDVGNAPAMNLSVETEELDHTSSRAGTSEVDKTVTTSQKLSVSFELDEINFQNLAVFFSGETSDSTAYTNPAVAGVTERTLISSAPDLAKTGGRWYDLVDDNNVRLYDINKSLLTLNSDTSGADNLLVEGTATGNDYEVDEKLARVFLRADSALIDAGDDITFAITADAGAVSPDEARALSKVSELVAVKFISVNPGDNDVEVEYQMHQIQLRAEGDMSLIGNEFSTMGMSGTLEKNTKADADSPFMTTRTHANA